jgi:hypothetical protein
LLEQSVQFQELVIVGLGGELLNFLGGGVELLLEISYEYFGYLKIGYTKNLQQKAFLKNYLR